MKLRWTPEDAELGRDLLAQAFEAPREVSRLEVFYSWLEASLYINMAVVRQLIGRAWRDGMSQELYDYIMRLYTITTH